MDELEAILETGGAAAVEIAASALAERGGTVGHCANCGHPMIGPYCAVCGQPINTHRRSLGHLLHEFFKDIISFDSRILRTARALLLEPGELPSHSARAAPSAICPRCGFICSSRCCSSCSCRSPASRSCSST